LRALVERQVRVRRKRSILGASWPAVAPVLLQALYVFVFGAVFDVGIPRYPEYLFTGLLPWTFLAQTIGQTVTSLSSEPDLIRRSPFPYELLPITTVVVMGMYFLATLAGFIVFLGVRGHLAYAVLPAIVLPVVALFLLVSSISMILSLVDVYNHDLRLILANLLTVWFFLVPIVYRPGMAPRPVRFLRSVDPMNMIVGQFRDILHFGQLSRPLHAGLMLVVCTALFVGSRAGFRVLSRELAKDI
jgi:ABC-type polysaccharide/polyol phosphate export permease